MGYVCGAIFYTYLMCIRFHFSAKVYWDFAYYLSGLFIFWKKWGILIG